MKHAFIIVLLLSSSSLVGQGFERTERDAGTIIINAGSSVIFNSLTIGYESPSLLGSIEKHKISLSLQSGLWHASLFNNNIGLQVKPQMVYLLGSNVHKLEINIGMALYLDSDLDDSGLNYIGKRQSYFLGYRFAPKAHSIFFRVGAGYPELLQIGLGYKI